MIYDKLTALPSYLKEEKYEALHSFINTVDINIALTEQSELPDIGFYKVITYETISQNWITESHLEFIDIQIVLSGEEIIRVYDKKNLEITKTYSSMSDCIFYKVGEAQFGAEIRLTPGKFAIFFPEDVHETQIAPDLNSGQIKKLVVKLKKEYFDK